MRLVDNVAYTIEVQENTDIVRFTQYEKLMKGFLKERAVTAKQLIEIDAEVNGGALVEIARVFGKPIYTRVNHRDMESAQQEIAELRSIIKDVVMSN